MSAGAKPFCVLTRPSNWTAPACWISTSAATV